jgi:hypothetical protein
MAVFPYAGDALWVVALVIMFSASRHAWGQTAVGQRLPFLGGQAPRVVALWMLPVASFAASLWLLLQARQAQGDMILIVFGVRAVLAALLALLHLRWVGQALKS